MALNGVRAIDGRRSLRVIYGVPSSKLLACRSGRGVRFLQLLSTILATDLNCFAGDLDFDGIALHFAVANSARFFSHCFSPRIPENGLGAVGHGNWRMRFQNL